jgi:PAS domain S-box-containing protein
MNSEKAATGVADKITLAVMVTVALVGVGVIAGWHLHLHALIQVLPGAIPMQYNTALCFLLLGASASAFVALRGNRLLPVIGGSLVALMGTLVVFQYVTGTSLGIDTMFFYPWERTLTSVPGRMALTTAISFTCAGVALVLLALRPQALSFFVIAHALPLSLGLTSLLGYVLGITYVLPFNLGSQMAVHTALAFFVYAGAMLAYAWRQATQVEDESSWWSPAIATFAVPVFFIGFSAFSGSDSPLSRITQLLFALACAALLALAINKVMRLKVTYKGLLLIAIPLIFVLGFVVLVTQVKRSSEEAQKWSLHSKEVIRQTEALSRMIVNAESNVRGFVITGDPTFNEAFNQAQGEVMEATGRLQSLISDNPEQEARVRILGQKASARMEFLIAGAELMLRDARDEAAAQIRTGTGKRLMDEFNREMAIFLQEQERLDALRQQRVDQSWQRFNWLLVAGASADILLALTLAILFSHGISSRLLTLNRNVQSLAVGKELARPMTGNDEIAQLDGVFHQMVDRLEEARRKERAVIENALDVICAIDLEGRFTQVSPASFKVWGYRPDELIGRRYIELVLPEDVAKTNEAAATIMAGNETTNFENRYLCKDGSAVSIRWSALWSEEDKLLYCVAHDVTESKRAEEKIKQLNEHLEKRSAQLEVANKELEAFSYSVSHDLRAPLRAIDGFSRMLMEDYAAQLDAEGRRYLNVVCANSKQMGQLIDDLLAFSRLSRKGVDKTDVDLTAMAQSVSEELQSLESERTIELTIKSLPEVQGDGAMLKQVFVNLISNALKFTRHKPEAKIEIGVNGVGRNTPVYHVKDNGAGFDMCYSDKLFGVFQRLHSVEEFDGTGVGLAIVQRIIHRHGGEVWAEAIVGEGATFYFTLSGDGENLNGNES